MKTLRLNFEDKIFKRLQNAKEEAKILGQIENWEEFILKLVGLLK